MVVLRNRNLSENAVRENPEMQTLTQEAVDEQIRGFIAALTHQLDELKGLLQEKFTSRHANSHLRTELGTTSGTAMPQSDTK